MTLFTLIFALLLEQLGSLAVGRLVLDSLAAMSGALVRRVKDGRVAQGRRACYEDE